MKNSTLRILAAALLGSAYGMAAAGTGPVPPTTTISGQSKKSDDEFFAGVNWNFGAKSGAALVLGYRAVKVHSDKKVRGAGVNLSFPINGGISLGELKLVGIDGRTRGQGELGAGWSFAAKSFLLTGAVQGNHVTGGADFVFGQGLSGYLGVNTIGRYDAPQPTTTLSCPAGMVLNTGTGFCEFPSTAE